MEKFGIIKIPLSPFSVVKLPKIPKAKDTDISVGKIRDIINLEDTNVYQNGTNRHNLYGIYLYFHFVCGEQTQRICTNVPILKTEEFPIIVQKQKIDVR